MGLGVDVAEQLVVVIDVKQNVLGVREDVKACLSEDISGDLYFLVYDLQVGNQKPVEVREVEDYSFSFLVSLTLPKLILS